MKSNEAMLMDFTTYVFLIYVFSSLDPGCGKEKGGKYTSLQYLQFYECASFLLQ